MKFKAMLHSFIYLGLVFFSFYTNPSYAKKSFVYCSEGSPSIFNPQLATDGPSLVAGANMVFNRLVDFKKGSTEIKPAIAESWTISADGKHYTFKLRKGIKFHITSFFTPTRELTADDVLFSFNRQRLATHPYHKVSNGTYTYFTGMEMDKIIADIKKIDDYTVEFILTRPVAPFIANLGMHFASILSKEYADAMLKKGTPEKFDQLPVGTGPFIFKSYVKDTVIRYQANKDYFLEKSPLDQVIFLITPDPSVRFQKLRAGECHFVTMPSPADLDNMEKDPQIKLVSKPGMNVGYVAMNVEKGPFKNKLVRQAINHALHRKTYITAIYQGHAMVAKNPLPPNIWSYNNKVQDYKYDPQKAKQLLAKAGYANGFTTELWTLPVSRPYNPAGKKMGELIQADLAKVGIKVKLVSYDWPTYLKKARQGEHEMIEFGWSGDNGDPDNFLGVLLSCSAVAAGSNSARWCNKKFDSLITKALAVTDTKKRSKLYYQAQEVFKKEAPWVTIAHSTVFRAMNKKVTGYEISPVTNDRFDGVDIK